MNNKYEITAMTLKERKKVMYKVTATKLQGALERIVNSIYYGNGENILMIKIALENCKSNEEQVILLNKIFDTLDVPVMILKVSCNDNLIYDQYDRVVDLDSLLR